MTIKNKKELDILREGGKRLAAILVDVAKAAKEGVVTKELDELAEKLILKAGGKPSFKGYKVHGAPMPYPGTICISINEEVVHGLASDRKLINGDIVGLDIGMWYEGLCTDTAMTVLVGSSLAHSDFLALNPLYGGSDASPKSECARSPLAYLRSRGLIDETIKEFRIGYAPQEWKSIFNHLLEKGFKADEIECAGLIVKSQNSKVAAQNYYDRFRGRIMFPIFDALGRVIAFGGRMFPDRENEAKYVNSPETNLYQKSKVLYGFNKSKSAILKAGECIVVEGYMDMIMSYKSGVKNVVASSGTALTADQLKILRRLSEKLITAFDMDKAGEDAARRGIALALTEGFEVGVAGSLSGLKDPADAVRKDPKIWKDAVKNSRHVIQFYIDTALAKFPASSHEAKREFQRTVIPAIVSLPDLEKAHWIKQIGKTLDIAEEAVWEALRKLQNPNNKLQTAENEIKQAAPNDRKLLLEGKILGILAQYPMLADKVESNFEPLLQRKGTAAVFAELFLNGAIEAETELAHCQRELKKEYLKARLENLSQIMREAEKNGNGGDRNILEFQRLMSELSKMQ